jgi:hypothetical protein
MRARRLLGGTCVTAAIAVPLACGGSTVVPGPTQQADAQESGATFLAPDAPNEPAAVGPFDATTPEADVAAITQSDDATLQGLPVDASGCTGGDFWGQDNTLAGDGGVRCTGHWDLTCAGQYYEVDCDCPVGECVCFGATTHVVAFPWCSEVTTSCSATSALQLRGQVFSLCDFPLRMN